MNYLEKKLTTIGWTQDEIKEEVIQTYHEVMETFNLSDDDNYITQVEEIIMDNFGVFCSVTELFDLYRKY